MERKRLDPARPPSGAAVLRSDLTEGLFAALFEEWGQYGYADISLERVAQRAGAGKAAIYRRWPSKREFASEAVETAGAGLTAFVDCGSLEADLTSYLAALRRLLRHRLVRRIVPDLFAERMRSGDLADMLVRLGATRRREGVAMLDRAIIRGELPETIDRELAMDCIPAPLYWRMIVRGRPVTRSDISKQVAMLLIALRAC